MTGYVHGESRTLANLRVQMNSAPGALHQASHDGEAEPCALPGWLGGEVGIEDSRENFRWNTRSIIGNRQGQQRSGVAETFPIEELVLRSVWEVRQINGFRVFFAGNLDLVRV